ncbi:hypothetical protein TWF706_008244 [Orbilia oligospora]|nr:hypothetical protein TWF103_005913 [Orbilia oligospora]KAF3114310.1 hypothetical protein TWF706_008244 [Orbilia oligospora]
MPSLQYGGYTGNGIEVTAEGRKEIEAFYSKGMRSVRDVANAIAGDRMNTYNVSILQELQRSDKIDFWSNGQPRKRLNPTECQILVRLYTRIAQLPRTFVSVASDSCGQYDEVIARVGSTNNRAMANYPYEILQSMPIGHLVMIRLPEENSARETPVLAHILFLSWSLASKHMIGRDSPDAEASIPQDPIRYISILKVSSRSKNAIQETLSFYGISVNERAGRLLGILGIILGITEVFAIQEMIRLYHDHPSLDNRVIEEIFITWKDNNFRVFVTLGSFGETLSGILY